MLELVKSLRSGACFLSAELEQSNVMKMIQLSSCDFQGWGGRGGGGGEGGKVMVIDLGAWDRGVESSKDCWVEAIVKERAAAGHSNDTKRECFNSGFEFFCKFSDSWRRSERAEPQERSRIDSGACTTILTARWKAACGERTPEHVAHTRARARPRSKMLDDESFKRKHPLGPNGALRRLETCACDVSAALMSVVYMVSKGQFVTFDALRNFAYHRETIVETFV